MFAFLDGLLPDEITVLDLAAGPGAVSERLLRRFPQARGVARSGLHDVAAAAVPQSMNPRVHPIAPRQCGPLLRCGRNKGTVPLAQLRQRARRGGRRMQDQAAVAALDDHEPTVDAPAMAPGAPGPSPPDASAPGVPASADHQHLWSLPDGTGLHARRGQLVREEGTGRACCHLCGRWFRSLGSHLRAHGWTAAAYREAMGLCATHPLTSPDLSSAIARRQSRAYRQDPQVRSRLAVGQDLARTGELRRLVRDAPGAGADVRDRPQQVEIRHDALRRGRETTARRRAAELRARLDALGARDLATYLRDAYCAGATIEELASTTGLGRTSLLAAMVEAGIAPRPQGFNSVTARRSRARSADAAAAARVGTDDLLAWLVRRSGEGWTLAQLGAAVGHSGRWVRWRLERAGGVTIARSSPAGVSRA